MVGHVQRLRSVELSFTLGILSTPNTQRERERWVGQNSGHIFRRLWTKVRQIKYACAWEIAGECSL